jgi:hypothetical protein
VEAEVVPGGFISRLKQRHRIRRQAAMLDWHDTREDGRTSFLWRRPALVPLFALVVSGGAIWTILARPDLAVGGQIFRLAVVLPIGLGVAECFGRWVWARTEHEYVQSVARALDATD